MSQRTAIVTGGARGIGRGCAHDLAKAGFNLVLVDLLEENLAATATEIRQLGTAVSTYVADVSDHTLAQSIAAEVIEQFGQVLVARITGKRDNPLFGNLLATIL